ncbi:MAG TPA: efflux RND transporter permease subunit [Candidatus Krumholzibacteria bacterium]|nr:efflux RND transporter permease subunit [Candidatus Krumholzibacteria bacterium]HPD70606.1 efflux RND transporter permease subunit [Candidatus Krumholzibacteria bacterium]HRY39694.1 efflux RND transporter permease subunit [Candidatus Krumholzibacteria bacterium]
MTRLAHLFIDSRLTPLLALAMLLIGLFALALTPREEEPQIVVPMIDVMVMLPGATPAEIENLVTKPLEQKVWEVEDVEYVYSASYSGFSLVTARYTVGTDLEAAMTRLWNKILGNMDLAPMGALQPIIKVRAIDDVPILTLTLWSDRYDLYDLRQLAGELRAEIAAVENVSVVDIHGGRRRTVRVELDPQRLAAFGVTTLSVLPALQMQNQSLPAGSLSMAGQEFAVETGAFLRDADDVRNLVVGVFGERPVRLMDVATVTDGPAEIDSYAFFGVGPRAGEIGLDTGTLPVGSEYPAVTLSVAKRKGSDATRVAEAVREKVAHLEGRLIPADVEVTVTRDNGETANEKARHLIESLGHAILLAIAVVFLAMGWRGSLIILVSIPTTFALTLFVYYMFGYTLNRVTLFALILVTGLVVDDMIIVVENIHRHFMETGKRSVRNALKAIEEIGNPTILATLTVIASLLPMAFVRGLMGPYMRPMPIGASAAMAFSLFVAFVFGPWLAMRLIKPHAAKGTEPGAGRPLQATRTYRLYSRIMRPLIEHPARGVLALAVIGALTVASTLLFFSRTVEVKMLPFDNKSEFQVIVDMPEGTTLERTTSVAREIGDYLATVPEVTDYQVYAGTAAPINFNGLVRHYMLRRGPNVADLQVNLVDKGERSDQSHAIATRVRGPIQQIAAEHGAAVKVVEVPPGPPVLATLVAEIYGPDAAGRLETAQRVREVFESTPGVVDVDWFVEADQTQYRFEVDKERAAVRGVSSQQVAQTLAVALAGFDGGLVHVDDAAEPVPVNLRLPIEDRSSPDALGDLFVGSRDGGLVPLSDIVRVEERPIPKSLHRRNLKPVVYVTGDVAGALESPIYAILDMKPRIAAIPLPSGVELAQHFAAQPGLTEDYSLKWDGEWHITYEVFRDLGVAFAVVIVIIYLLIVAMFQNFTIPLLMMIPVPLTLIGIIPGHLLLGAFFTATSMIGLIALAGIMVRNSILLIDFIVVRRRQGLPLAEAVIEAGAVRFMPIALTAGCVITGSFVMIFDPIFQGLAISLMSGAFMSTVLTMVVIPLAYYLYARSAERRR